MKQPGVEKQEGFVLVVVAGILIVLIGFVALGVDTGALYSARTSAQQVADAAAIAGAFSYINTPNAPDMAAAVTGNALEVAVNNTVLGQAIAVGDVTVAPDVNNNRVTVTVRSAQPTYFARAIWGNTANITVTATAEAARNSTGSSCVRPWFIPNTVFAQGAPCDDMGGITRACNPTQLLVDTSVTPRVVTAFGKTKIGQAFTLKPQSPQDAIAPGQFYAIDIPNDLTGDDYRNNISTCTNALVRCNQNYSVLTGNRVGPTQQGVMDLLGIEKGGDPLFTYIAEGKYERESDGKVLDIAPNVIVAPIWDTCTPLAGYCPDNDFPQGTMVELKVVGFAIIFLVGINPGGDVEAILVNISGCGTTQGGPDPGNAGGTVLSFPLRLVRMP